MSATPKTTAKVMPNEPQVSQLSKDELNKQDKDGKTLLHHAVIAENLALVEKYIKQGARLDICDNKFYPPLRYSKPNSAIEKTLLKHGSPIRRCTELHLAAAKGDIKRIDEILSSNSFLLCIPDSKSSIPLFYAVKNGHIDTAKHLLSKGSPYDWVNSEQQNLVDIAKKNGKDTPLSLFLEKQIALSESETDLIVKPFKEILEKEYAIAKKLNKKIVILLGEIHGVYSIRELEKQLLKVAKDIGINQFVIELPSGLSYKYPIELAAEKLGMTVSRVDTHIYRQDATLDQRNIEMTTKVKQLEQDCVMLVGARHLKGIVNKKSVKLPPEKFHVIPFNLGPIAADGIYGFIATESHFIDQKENVIQVSRKGISESAVVINTLNLNKANPNPPNKLINLLATITAAILNAYPIYLLYVYVGVLVTVGIILATITIGTCYLYFTEHQKTFGLKDYQSIKKDNSIVIHQDRLRAFMDGTHNSIFNRIYSCFVYRDWRYMRDYYAGCVAKETEKEKLIQTVKARIK